jgi:hypothetical protein
MLTNEPGGCREGSGRSAAACWPARQPTLLRTILGGIQRDVEQVCQLELIPTRGWRIVLSRLPTALTAERTASGCQNARGTLVHQRKSPASGYDAEVRLRPIEFPRRSLRH